MILKWSFFRSEGRVQWAKQQGQAWPPDSVLSVPVSLLSHNCFRCTSTLTILNACISTCALLSTCFSCTAINDVAFLQPEIDICIFIQHRNVPNIGQRLNSLRKCWAPTYSQVFQELHSWFHLSSDQREFYFHHCWVSSLTRATTTPIPSTNILSYCGEIWTWSSSSGLQWKLQLWPSGSQGKNPTLLVTMNLSLGNIAGLWNFLVCILI